MEQYRCSRKARKARVCLHLFTARSRYKLGDYKKRCGVIIECLIEPDDVRDMNYTTSEFLNHMTRDVMTSDLMNQIA